MVKLKVAKPGKRVGTSNLQFVRRVPVDLIDEARKHQWGFVFPPTHGVKEKYVMLNISKQGIISFTYGSDSTAVVVERARKAHYEFDLFLNFVRSTLVPPNDKTIESYAVNVYLLNQDVEDTTGLPSAQKTHSAIMDLHGERYNKIKSIIHRGGENIDPFHIPFECFPFIYPSDDHRMVCKEYRVGYLVNWWLQENDKKLSLNDRERLVAATDALFYRALEGKFDVADWIKKNSIKSDSPRKDAAREFSKVSSISPVKKNDVSKHTLTDVFEAWTLRKTNRSHNSIRSWSGVVKFLIGSLGHDIADKVTAEDIETWKAQVLASGTVAGKTFNKSHYNAVKALFNFAHKKEWISHNPTVNLTTVDVVENKSVRKAYFSREVVQILSKMIGKVDKPWKWIPLLVGFTGARVGEIAQLHASQVGPDEEHLDIWCINMTELLPQQTLKTQESRRIVPLHPKFFGREFYEFVKSRKGKYLFANVDPQRKYNTSPFAPAMRESRAWIISVFPEKLAQGPHHGFRHFFKTEALKKNKDTKKLKHIDIDALQYVQGHKREYSTQTYRTPDQRECLNLIEAVFDDLDFSPS